MSSRDGSGYGAMATRTSPDTGPTRVTLRDRLDGLSSVQGPPSNLCAWHPAATIFKVPPLLRNEDSAAYEPRVVAIGPYHRHKVTEAVLFVETEQLKLRYLHEFLTLTRDRRSFDDYLTAMRALEARARSCYSERTDAMDGDEFSEMLLLDGCFLLCYLLKMCRCPERQPAWAVGRQMSYDLLLLENQIPFFVLDKLYELFRNPKHELPPLIDVVILDFCDRFLIRTQPWQSGEAPEREPCHLLDILHSCIRPKRPHTGPKDASCLRFRSWKVDTLQGAGFVDEGATSIHMATELHDAGIKFRSNKDEGFPMLEVGFWNGVLEMPLLRINDEMLPLLQNLVAFEQCRWGSEEHVTSFVCFMSCLMKNHTDVALLRRKGMVVNCLGSDEEVAMAFLKLSKNVLFSYEKSRLKKLVGDVNMHYRRRRSWERWKAELVQSYVGSPWKIASVAAAVVLLVLTFMQTIYTVASFDKNQ